ncbi:hypothetical protein HDU76_010953 [Blyttiomyces sp. JEL0837]|nr:hypothetical protein HDU76_010953 [Blyttiomyces sp. JEL0837]
MSLHGTTVPPPNSHISTNSQSPPPQSTSSAISPSATTPLPTGPNITDPTEAWESFCRETKRSSDDLLKDAQLEVERQLAVEARLASTFQHMGAVPSISLRREDLTAISSSSSSLIDDGRGQIPLFWTESISPGNNEGDGRAPADSGVSSLHSVNNTTTGPPLPTAGPTPNPSSSTKPTTSTSSTSSTTSIALEQVASTGG